MNSPVSLKRCISYPLLTFYGLGTIVGAGIYVLVGKVAGTAGYAVPLAFLTAAIVAAFTAFTYAELSSRFPRSSGESFYIGKAFGRQWLSAITGYSIVAIGVVSSATIANGFVGYLNVFIELPSWLVISGIVILLGAIAAWGIKESVILATFITVLELGGLLFVLFVAGDALADLPEKLPLMLPTAESFAFQGLIMGAFLAFYAFIGFEDMVNVAEEVEDPSKTLPSAILTALVVSTMLYVLIATVAVLAVSPQVLEQSEAPLADIIEQRSNFSPHFISAISMVAIINGALIQIIMASRVLYGMSHQGISARLFRVIHPQTRTPLKATALITFMVLLLALWFPIVTLAVITSFITLIVFAAMHLALFRIKLRGDKGGEVTYPIWIPVIGFILSSILLLLQIVVS